MGTRLFSLPLNRAVELRYCRAYYEKHDPSVLPERPGAEIPESMCKVKEVQQRLAWLQGVVETLVVGIDLAVTLPLGWYTSKRYGWKFEHVGYLLSIKAAVNITLLALVIPMTMRTLLKRMPGKEVRLNYSGAQISLAVSILGALSIAAAGTVGLLMCGESD
ncbi:hypothetical protein SLS54_009214 [Diplodia seriata]